MCIQKSRVNSLLTEEDKTELELVAATIRCFAAEMVEQAASGHPGLPMGCAELGAYLFGKFLRFNPSDPDWEGRDRFLLSAGHGCALLYTCLHLSGYDVSIEDLKRFRKLDSITPGHPERGITPGVESTTGPLGQGLGHAVGQALGIQIVYHALGWSSSEETYCLPKVVALCGDGCLMEGISYESAAFAGHLSLDNLIVIYDANGICLDGPISSCWSEDVALRFRAAGWEIFEVDGNDFVSIHKAFSCLQTQQTRPTLIIAQTVIGKGSPNKSGSHIAHGSPLGEEEISLVKQGVGFPAVPFYVPKQVYSFFLRRRSEVEDWFSNWSKWWQAWIAKNEDRTTLWKAFSQKTIASVLKKHVKALILDPSKPARELSQEVVSVLCDKFPHLYGGSADLSSSDKTFLKNHSVLTQHNFLGKNIKFGVREFAMSAIASGMSQTKKITPFIGTFLTFSDYMRNSIRLAALMKLQVIYVFSHDSVFLGEDGPTHQPIEHIMSLRLIPGLQVIRPGTLEEVKSSWVMALEYPGPSAIIVARHKFGELSSKIYPIEDIMYGGYEYFSSGEQHVDCTIVATGSELSLAYLVAKELKDRYQKAVSVVSLLCWSRFEKQTQAYQDGVLRKNTPLIVSIEAGSALGWTRYIGCNGLSIAIETWGASGSPDDLHERYGFTVTQVIDKILKKMQNH